MERKMKLTHPGLILREEIEARGLSITDAAKLLKVTHSTLAAVLNGSNGISPALALQMEQIIGGSAHFWVNLQAAYEQKSCP